jgi:hypothetical protein
MAVGTVTKYNQLEKQIFADANRQWDDATAGNIMFCLVGNGYTPAATHTTTADLSTNLISAGDGATRVAATGLAIDDTTTAGTTYYDSADVTWGTSVTITAKYLVCVQPVAANTFDASTSKLLFYVDLDTTSGSATVSSVASTFTVFAPTNGWFKTV